MPGSQATPGFLSWARNQNGHSKKETGNSLSICPETFYFRLTLIYDCVILNIVILTCHPYEEEVVSIMSDSNSYQRGAAASLLALR